ncbi:Rapamycin-insensitive companion of mTOR, middle domain-domain-containing protein [Naematelia encephala]|uniref:Rapamycin-insensitive companion of mTOR, middle domain-domain-containing protein n=1 Tax=Naematelia encephala TaxID=71784 RepID=A0A1Y2AZL2_9TREE|nr:Rapamycin-insensitive companion of mTOR, middle domain-domain-containing protein [Naematelia encephala]
MAYARVSPVRPSLETFHSSSSVLGAGNGGGNLEDEVAKQDEEGETVESLMSKLAIERRVQYGAEKMLDVIEKRGGGDGESEQVRERITTQLEAANEHIKMLEARLERLNGGAQTPHRNRRRPQPMLHGYPSTSSLGQGLSSSFASSTGLSASRPRLPRQASNLTPDREPANYPLPLSGHGTPNRPSGVSPLTSRPRRRSRSVGEDSLDYGSDGLSSSKLLARSRSDMTAEGGEHQAVMLETFGVQLRRLRDLNREKGKGKASDRGDEEWECLTRLAEVLKKSDGLKGLVDVEEVVECVIPYLDDASTNRRRAAAYRVLRYVLDRPGWGHMISAGLEWLITRTFTRDSKAVHEREQALRLLRAVIVLPLPPRHLLLRSPVISRGDTSQSPPGRGYSRQPSFSDHSQQPSRPSYARQPSVSSHRRGPVSPPDPDPIGELLSRRLPLTDAMVRAVVSVAENPDDPMRMICLQTLVEIGILDIERLIRSEAFRTILQAIKDGPAELGPAMTGLMLYLTNHPSSRQFLLPGSDVESVLVGITETYGKIPSRQQARLSDKLQNSVRCISMLLNTWTGFLYLLMDDARAIRSLISSLHVPIVEEAMLDLTFSALRIKRPSWMNAFLAGKRLTVYNRTQEATSQLQDGIDEEEPPQHLNLLDHYVALLLAVLIENGLVESLVIVIEDGDASAIHRKCTLLLGEILQMANRILPLQYAAKLQSLPRLFTGATKFSCPEEMHVALSALSAIDSLNRNQSKAAKQAVKDRPRNLAQDSLQRGQRQVQQVRLRLGLQIEDRQFQQMVNDSGVLLGRDHTKWNYEVILELIEGPLLNAKRLDEAIKATKFIRRIFSFFHPYNNRFSSIKRTRPNHKWVRLGCALLSTMLVNAEGIRFISEDKLLRQMVECFSELDQYTGPVSPTPVFARDRIENSLTYGYFEFIGTLSKHREGAKLLEKFKFFTCFYHLSEQRSRDDITRIIIECFDYTIDGHPRIVLSKALTSAYMETRLFATHHLGRLLQDSPTLKDWALQLMITQLYDTSIEVCDVAVMYLEEVCHDPACLEEVVRLRPSLEHLGEIGGPLFMQFVSTSVGFQYLHQSQYIERELDLWLTERNLLYVIETETWVSKTLRPFTSDTVEDYWSYESMAPTHFFGELTKTPEGCQLLKSRGIVADCAEIVRLHGMEAEDQSILMNVKSVLWCLGNIGSTSGGLPFLEEEEIIEVIVEIAERSPVLTMKGTCFFVIGLISSTRMGAELLEELGWIATRTPLGLTTGLCLPSDISRFAYIEPWTRPELPPGRPSLPKLTGLEGEIMTFIANLSNYVLAAGAMNNLKKLRSKHSRYFSSITLFHRALRMISTNHYQAPVRRFILDLFDVALTQESLLQLRHLELASYNSPHIIVDDDEVVGDGRAHDIGHEYEHRRRATSSPGPQPPDRAARTRGLTISEMGPNLSVEGVNHEARQHVRGFGIQEELMEPTA